MVHVKHHDYPCYTAISDNDKQSDAKVDTQEARRMRDQVLTGHGRNALLLALVSPNGLVRCLPENSGTAQVSEQPQLTQGSHRHCRWHERHQEPLPQEIAGTLKSTFQEDADNDLEDLVPP